MAGRLDPAELRAVRKYGPQVNTMARGYGIKGRNPGARLLAKLIIGESGGNENAVSSAGAKGRTQFMPGTRQAVLQYTGGKVDPWGSADDAVHAAVIHLKGKLGHKKGLEGYNPGMPSYAGYILNQKAGSLGGGGAAPPTMGGDPGRVNQLERMMGSSTTTDLRAAMIDSLAHPSQRRGSLLHDIRDRVRTGAYTSTEQSTIFEREKNIPNQQAPPTVDSGNIGDFTVSSGANRPGHPMHKAVLDFAGRLAGRVGQFEIGTGTQHSRLTVNGNVSEHWGGDAFDAPATGQRLIKLMEGALIEAGVKPKKAKRMAKNGGLYNITRNGVRYQIIGRTMEGGDHWDHLHVGISER